MWQSQCTLLLLCISLVILATANANTPKPANECRPEVKKVVLPCPCEKRLFKCSPVASDPICAYSNHYKPEYKIYPNGCIMGAEQECQKYVYVAVPSRCCNGTKPPQDTTS